jgi:pseudaminic acid synthase
MKNNYFFKNLKSVFIVAELSANHNNSIETALESVKEAKNAGANAIKLQTYTPDTMTLDVLSDDFKINNGSIWDGETLYDLYRKAHTPWDWHEKIFEEAKKQNIICFSTPFDKTSVDFLETLGNPIYKIASFEINDISLIKYVASKGKPIIISTGVATIDDINLAIKTIESQGNKDISILKCTSSYPTPLDQANLKMITDFEKKFKYPVGLSDHTHGIIAPLVATSLGSKIIEKHFILDRSLGGPDSTFSLNKDEFSNMVKEIRNVEKVMGVVDYNLTENQKKSTQFKRSLYIAMDVKAGELVTENNVKSIRPSFGLHPKYLEEIINKRFIQDLKKGTPLKLNHFK